MQSGYFLTEDYKQRIDAKLRENPHGLNIPEQFLGPASFEIVPYKCAAQVPAWGVMRVTGVTLDEDNQPRVDTAQPNTTFQRRYLVNLAQDGEDGSDGYYYGGGVWLSHAGFVLYDIVDGSPVYGETWGPASGQWTVKKNRWGFDIVGGVGGTGTESRVQAMQHTVNHVLGKTNAAHNKGASGTLNLYAGTLGSETTISMSVTAWNRYVNLGSGKWAEADWVGGGWSITAGECV